MDKDLINGIPNVITAITGFIVALCTAGGGLYTLYIKSKRYQKIESEMQRRETKDGNDLLFSKLEELNAKGQKRDDIIGELVIKVDKIETNVNRIETKVENIETNTVDFYELLKKSTFENDLKFSIIDKVNDIFTLNPNIDSNFKHLICQGRDRTIEFAIQMRTYPVTITRENLKIEISNVFDSLKLTCNSYFDTNINVNDKMISFSKYLRENTQINSQSELLGMRILENHKDNTAYIKMFTEYIQVICLEGIKAFNDFKMLQK